MKRLLLLLAAAPLLAGFARPLPLPGVPPNRLELAMTLALDAERAGKVDAILRSAYEKCLALNEHVVREPENPALRAVLLSQLEVIEDQKRQRLASVLNELELAKLEVVQPPVRTRGPALVFRKG